MECATEQRGKTGECPALARVRTFVAKFNAYASLGKPEPVRVVGALHTDNAGEFLSREFVEFLDEELIDANVGLKLGVEVLGVERSR